VKTYDLVELAARNLRESILRNSLTTVGIAVGVASLVAMLSLGIGLQESWTARLGRSGLFDTVMVYSRRDISSFDPAERRNNPNPPDSRELDIAARRDLEKIPNVIEVYPEIRFQTEVRYGDASRFTMVAGLPLSAKQNELFDEMQGKFFSGPEADEAILQSDFAKSLEPDSAKLIGQELILRYAERQPLPAASAGAQKTNGPGTTSDAGFSIVRREKKLRIVGIAENEPFGGWRSFARGRVFIPTALAEKLNVVQAGMMRETLRAMPTTPTYSSLLVRVDTPAQVQNVQNAIKDLGFTTWSILDMTQRMQQIFVILDLFLGIFGSLALAVASLGIVNTLVMAILERRREIGIMKALGASDGDVKRLFFAEAGTMGFFGGLAGVTLGWAIGRIINLGTTIYLERRSLPPEDVWLVPWWLVAGAIGFSIVVSLVAGLYPAARAAKLDPVQALRYE
jgi:putative ABC transport system permease protein